MAFGGIDLVLDRQLGFLNTLLTAPISRASIYFSGVAQNMVKAMSLALLTFVVAVLLPKGLALGVGFGILDFLGAFAAFALLAFALSCVFTALALSVNSIDSLVAIVNFATFPLVFTSSALFPQGGFPGLVTGNIKRKPNNEGHQRSEALDDKWNPLLRPARGVHGRHRVSARVCYRDGCSRLSGGEQSAVTKVMSQVEEILRRHLN